MVRRERSEAFQEALDDLRRYARTYDEPTFLASRDAQRLVLHALYIAVQACLDEAMERCKALGLPEPASYRDSFTALARAGQLDAHLALRLSDWASFRNVLAHFYPVLDLRRVYAALAELHDLEAFQHG